VKTKQCPKCERILEAPKDFHKDKQKGDGFSTYCKDCYKVKNTTPEARARSIAYGKTEQGKARRLKHARTPNGRARALAGKQRYRARNKKKYAARTAVMHAVESGDLPKVSTQTCKCGQQAASHHHHLGYEECNWLEVIPLCQDCHSKADHVETE
jgi:hypothetical protein